MLEEDKKVEIVQEYTYAILQETSGEECESWLYFIRYQGNEEALKHLQVQLQSVDWYILDDLSTFDLEMDHLVSENTAKDMIRVDLNHYSPHRKFDGVLKMIDIGLKSHHRNEKKMGKVFDVLGYGQIEDYIDNEEIDPNKLATGSEAETSSEEEDTSSSFYDEEHSPSPINTSSEEETTSSEEETSSSEEEKVTKKKGKLPKILEKKTHEIPRVAKAKQARANKNKAKKPNK